MQHIPLRTMGMQHIHHPGYGREEATLVGMGEEATLVGMEERIPWWVWRGGYPGVCTRLPWWVYTLPTMVYTPPSRVYTDVQQSRVVTASSRCGAGVCRADLLGSNL